MRLPNLAEPVDAWESRSKKTDEEGPRESDDVQEVAFDPFDEARAETLDRVPARAALPLARCHVVPQLARREVAERHERRLGVKLLPGRSPQAEPGDDRVRPPRERLDHRLRLRLARRLPEELAVEEHLGVDAEHGSFVRFDGVGLPGGTLDRARPRALLVTG